LPTCGLIPARLPLPIVILGPPETKAKVAYLLRTKRYQPIHYVNESFTEPIFSGQIRPFLEQMKTPPVSQARRKFFTESAAYWMGQIAVGQRTNIYDISSSENVLFELVSDPGTRINALIALGAIRTGTVQKKFSDLAVTPTRTKEEREFGAIQLAAHIQRNGLLLDKADILAIRKAREQTKEPDLHTALTSVIGSLRPDATTVQERLQNFPKPVLPKPDAGN